MEKNNFETMFSALEKDILNNQRPEQKNRIKLRRIQVRRTAEPDRENPNGQKRQRDPLYARN